MVYVPLLFFPIIRFRRMVDAEPQRLGIELVNRYHAIKRAGLI